MEVGQVKEEQIKPTRKRLAAILQEYHQDQRVQKSTVESQLERFELTKDDTYRCGSCGYHAEIGAKLDAHWSQGCRLEDVERENGMAPEAYQCHACGYRNKSINQVEKHMYVCQGFSNDAK